MKLTKQKTWMMIEIAMAAYLIISSCEEPDKRYAKNEKQITQNIKPFLKLFLSPIPFLFTILNNYFIKPSSSSNH
ncbi:MAG: hypothetical protein Q8891_10565 [Bacteroidota bacterium]|nr:hypothetical protein [Bacteroidota bacterium]